MRGLTVPQPYASLISVGALTSVVRSGPVPHEAVDEVVAIHAGKMENTDRRNHELVVHYLGNDQLPQGSIVAVARIKDSLYWDKAWPGSEESELNDFYIGCWYWRLVDIHRLAKPVPYKGSRGLWSMPFQLQIDLLNMMGDVVAFDEHR